MARVEAWCNWLEVLFHGEDFQSAAYDKLFPNHCFGGEDVPETERSFAAGRSGRGLFVIAGFLNPDILYLFE